MFGTLRLILSLCVALSHVGVSIPGGYHLGVPAVMVFLVLAGYIVAARLESNASVRAFYIERCWRLLPMYYACIILAICVWHVTGPRLFWPDRPGFFEWLSNIIVFPLNFGDQGGNRLILLPPTWSLSLEMQFYILAPLVVCSRKIFLPVICLSVAFFTYATLVSSEPDPWGYRYLPAVLWAFLSGSAIKMENKRIYFFLLVWMSGVMLVVLCTGRQILHFTVETSSGGVIGMALVSLLSRLPRRRVDDLLGRYAYPVFLVHFPLRYALGPLGREGEAGWLCWYVGGNILVAIALHHMVEIPVKFWRQRFFNRDAALRAVARG